MPDQLEIPTDWSFKSLNVAANFDRHVREQLPWYELVSGAVAHIARHYLPTDGLIYDVGASTGNIGRLLADTLENKNAELVAIDNSEQMFDQYTGPGRTVVADALTFDFEPFDVAVCHLVLCFLPVKDRVAFVARLKSQCRVGGAIIVVDKSASVSGDGYLDTVLYRLALAGKVASGTDATEIISKELSLAGSQRPVDPRVDLRGFDEWFRFGHFAGWVHTKKGAV